MATVSTVGIVDRREFSNWFHVFQGANSRWRADGRMLAGNFFIGLQAYNCCIFNGADIPPGSTILSAEAEYTTHQTGNGNPITIQLNTPDRSAGSIYRAEPLQTPFGAKGWRGVFWGAWDTDLRNAGLVVIAQSPVVTAANNISWASNFENSTAVGVSPPAMRTSQASRMQPLAAGGGQVLALALARLSRVGVLPVSTNLFLDVHATQVENGITIPGAVLATSDPVLASTIGGQANYLFLFSGINQITLTVGVEVHMALRFSPLPPVSAANYIACWGRQAFFQLEQWLHFGAGVGLDWGNFPSTADVAVTTVQNIWGTNVTWNPANFPAIGSKHVTPDLTALVQLQVDDPGYEASGRVLMISQFTAGQNPQNRVWASFNSGIVDSEPLIRVTYLEPPEPVAEKLADPWTGRNRFVEPFDRGYHIWKYGRSTVDPQYSDPLKTPVSSMEKPLDHRDLESYVHELGQAIVHGDAENMVLGIVDATEQEQRAMIDQLEQNLADARAELLAAIQRQRRRNNQAAIAAAIEYYYSR